MPILKRDVIFWVLFAAVLNGGTNYTIGMIVARTPLTQADIR